MSEPETMPGDPQTDVDICRHDDGSIVMVFGAGTPASDLATAFASLPRDACMSDITTTWFSEQDDCEGQDVPDDAHIHPVTNILLMPAPAELPAGAEDRS